MYVLVDTFNRRVISRHRTLAALVVARKRLARNVRKGHGSGAYLPTCVGVSEKGAWLDVGATRQMPDIRALNAHEQDMLDSTYI